MPGPDRHSLPAWRYFFGCAPIACSPLGLWFCGSRVGVGAQKGPVLEDYGVLEGEGATPSLGLYKAQN